MYAVYECKLKYTLWTVTLEPYGNYINYISVKRWPSDKVKENCVSKYVVLYNYHLVIKYLDGIPEYHVIAS